MSVVDSLVGRLHKFGPPMTISARRFPLTRRCRIEERKDVDSSARNVNVASFIRLRDCQATETAVAASEHARAKAGHTA